MALHQFALLSDGPLLDNKIFPSKTKSSLSTTKSSSVPCTIQCKASTTIISDQNNTHGIARRSANYFKPSIWHYDYIQSLRSDYAEESYTEESARLKEEIRVMLSKLADPLDQLELVDVLQRLGLAAYFSLEIRNIMEKVYNSTVTFQRHNDLYATALVFRLFRQHGFDVSPEVFNGFLDDKANFDSHLSGDIMGLLSLYEASFHSLEDEIILDKARDFSSKYLNEFVDKSNQDNEISLLVNHALELPLHWRISRLESRWFTEVYGRRQNLSPALVKLAKLDFNMVQAKHQEDLKHASRWGKRIGLGENLNFVRDRLVESFFWAVAMAFEPELGYFRNVITKVVALLTAIDDIYDAYGTEEELELFTYVADRWDINTVDILPDYMKICFLALYNFVNEVAFDYLNENGHNILPHLKKVWADLCKSCLVEAKWHNDGYQPSLQEYLENAWVSSCAPVVLVHAYYLLPSSTKKEDLFCLEEYPDIIQMSGMILRLVNDLGTYKREKETGDALNSIESYTIETGVSEAEARRHINTLIHGTWKKINKEASKSCYSKSFVELAVNIARTSHCLYQHGDGLTDQDPQTSNRMKSLFL